MKAKIHSLLLSLVVLALFGACSVAEGANVVWDYLSSENIGGSVNAYYYDSSIGYTEIGFAVSHDGVVSSDGSQAIPWAGVVDRAVAETVVEYDAFLGTQHFIFQNSNGEVYGSDYSFHVEANSSFYLMFKTSVDSESSNPYYGWAEFGVDGDYNVALLHSAIDLDHDPIVVGARSGPTPEPTSGVLVLLGLVALGLRRRGRSGGCSRADAYLC